MIGDQTGYDQLRGLPAVERGTFAAAFDSLLNDLNTPEALGQIFSALKEVKPAELSSEEALRELRGLHFVMAALGLSIPELKDETVEAPESIRELAERRWAARTAKDWAASDALRAELGELGWEMKDGKEGYELRPKG